MTNSEIINFQIIIIDICESNGIKTGDDLRVLSEELHDSLESAVQEYANDNDIEDYIPCY